MSLRDPEKSFDCVEMKDEIQVQLLAEQEGLTEEQVQAAARDMLARLETPLGRLWRVLARNKA